MFLAEKDLHKI